jgi:hypothetical protein
LNQVDVDGKSALSDMIKIDFKSKQNEIINVFPNPSKGAVNIETSELANYSILDINGKEIANGMVNGQLELNQLAPGLYMVKVTMYDTIKNIKLIIQ